MLLYATADRKYYDEHAKAFLRSAKLCGMEARVDLVHSHPLFDDRKTFYSCARFLNLPSLLDEHESVLVVDVDSIFNQKIEIDPAYELGIFFRKYLPSPDMKVLCSASYFTRKAKSFAEQIASNILNEDKNWCCDQRAVWEAYKQVGHKFSILNLNRDFVNFEFDIEAPIWTAKGIYRKENPVYLARRESYAYQ